MIDFKDLSEPQQEIINLRSDKNYVIQGGAGTGKTVIALYRAKKMSDENRKSIILVHNIPLKKYIENAIQVLGIRENCTTWTYHVWLGARSARGRSCRRPRNRDATPSRRTRA